MLALLTSCGRPDLLERTLDSLFENQKQVLAVTVHEDAVDPGYSLAKMQSKYHGMVKIIHSRLQNQHWSIELFVKSHIQSKYYLHLEEDWLFYNSYDWIADSLKVMADDDRIIKVLARKDSPHPCEHDRQTEDGVVYGIVEPWENNGILWSGFSWNPGVTRMEPMRYLLPYPKYEQELAADMHRRGYKVAELEKGVYQHIGEGRSTHE